MKKLTVITSVMFSILVFSYTAQAIHDTIPAESQIVQPEADAANLYEYIIKIKPYTTWQLFPGKDKMYPGSQPHGAFLTTYVNDTAYYSIADEKGMSDGSIIVKENYTTDKKLDFLTVMYKMNGYNPKARDWFWAKYAVNGNVLASGRVEACISCHRGKKDRDYIFSGIVGRGK